MTSFGRYENLNGREHFIPQPLALLPRLDTTGDILTLFGETMKSMGKLENAAESIAHPQQIARAYITKEALFSSEIEGTAVTLANVLEAQSEHGDPTNLENKGVRNVLNCVEAAQAAVRMLREENLPLNENVIKTVHQFLLKETAGKNPGMYRDGSDGSAMAELHVPPPAQYVPDLMSDLETFLNTDTYPPLLRAGIAHAQFEAIHPFWDENGRIGRLLILLTLLKNEVISAPLLYPSYYFKRFRSVYHAHLAGIRENGDWRSWMRFYLRAMNETAYDATDRIKRLTEVIEFFQERIAELPVKLGPVVLDRLLESPIFNVNQLAKSLSYSFSGANAITKRLEKAKVVRQIYATRLFRRYKLEGYMRVLEDDTPFATDQSHG